MYIHVEKPSFCIKVFGGVDAYILGDDAVKEILKETLKGSNLAWLRLILNSARYWGGSRNLKGEGTYIDSVSVSVCLSVCLSVRLLKLYFRSKINVKI